jgi:Tfp pilus assembly protein PilP
MSTQAPEDKTTPTTEKTQSAATLPDLLPLDGITLLGTVVAGDASRALIRMRNGKVQQLRAGDHVGDATIAAIEPGLIHMILRGEAQRLAMP